GPGAGALGADVEAVGAVDPGDAAAAGADGLDVEHGQGQLVALEDRRVPAQRLPVVDDADVEGGATHVGQQEVVDADPTGQQLRAHDAGHRSGVDGADRGAPGLFPGDGPAGALGEEDLAGEAVGRRPGLDALDVPVHEGADVGVHHRGGGPLVLPHLGDQVGSAGHEDV